MRKLLLVTLTALAACNAPPVATDAETPQAPIVGGDRDAHGCIASAGYAWCASTGACERPWELAQRFQFTLSTENFTAFCAQQTAPPVPGPQAPG
ncbi:MAG TPA: hypothetical protein VGE51_10565 [Fontimonas sp.]